MENSAPAACISVNFYIEYFSKIFRENSNFIEIWQEQRSLHIKTNLHCLSYLVQFFLEWEMFQTKAVENITTHILCSINFFFENSAVYEIMWKNIVKPSRPQIDKWQMRISRGVPNATNKHSQYVKITAFPLQQRLQECTSVLCYTYSAACLV